MGVLLIVSIVACSHAHARRAICQVVCVHPSAKTCTCSRRSGAGRLFSGAPPAAAARFRPDNTFHTFFQRSNAPTALTRAPRLALPSKPYSARLDRSAACRSFASARIRVLSMLAVAAGPVLGPPPLAACRPPPGCCSDHDMSDRASSNPINLRRSLPDTLPPEGLGGVTGTGASERGTTQSCRSARFT